MTPRALANASPRVARGRPRASTRRDGRRRATAGAGFVTRTRRRRVARAANEDAASERTRANASAMPSKTLRGMFDAVRGFVLEPSRDGGEASSGGASGGASASRLRKVIGSFVMDVSQSFDELTDAPSMTTDGAANLRTTAARRRRARTLTAERRRRRRDAKTRDELSALAPEVEVLTLNAVQRRAIGLDCDEMHFVPVGDASGWSAALLRYKAKEGVETRRPIVMVPGCASNGMTFDVDKTVSLPRYLTERGHEVWIVETRGVGYARRWTRPRSDYVEVAPPTDSIGEGSGGGIEIPMMRSVGFGLWDFDTLLNEDLFCSCEYIAEVCRRGDLAGVGHSMGGMLLASLAAVGPKESDIGVNCSWSMTRVCTMASCLECSSESDPESPASVYARFAALAGHLPRGLTANPSTTTVHLPIAPASVATAEAFQFVLGPPPPIDGDGASAPDPAKAFWRNSVSPVTCHPGATDSEFLRRLLLRGFNNVPLSLLIQMATLFTPGGMRSRDPSMGVDESSSVRARIARDSERLKYLDELQRARVPVLAIAGDVDPIFPPNQVKAYARKVDAEYHVFGDASSPRDDPDTHYSHYDVICGRHAPHKVFPIVAEFLER